MLDLISFKNINDQYGHHTGDEALKYTATILQETYQTRCFISRYGGDEFVVLLELKDKSDLEQAINDLQLNLKEFNKAKILPYAINFSVGADIYDEKSGMSEQDFLNHIDLLMYKDKRTLLNKLEALG